jgi:hypothetical protein
MTVIPAAQDTADVASEAATRAFSTSILISAIRCTLAYVVFPWVLPAAGFAGGIGPALGLAIGAVALVCNAISIRRFWVSNHRWKWPITVLNVSVMVLVSILVVEDVAALT